MLMELLIIISQDDTSRDIVNLGNTSNQEYDNIYYYNISGVTIGGFYNIQDRPFILTFTKKT
jgi:hypothetical protein